jgi:hypothetical protein
MMKIANFFSIPLSDLIEKDLSVNELLHYNPRFVIEPDKLKSSRRLVSIPYVSAAYINNYIQLYRDNAFIRQLPSLTLPCNATSEVIAIEIQDQNLLPAGFEFRPGDILVFEQVTKENIHRIIGRLGMMVGGDCLRFGTYQTDGVNRILSLNEWVSYPFDINTEKVNWLLQATYRQE